MKRKKFLYKIYPPRPDFYSDQNPDEKSIMKKHIQYWKQLTDEKSSIVYGPVYEPKGTFPMAVIEVRNMEEAENIAINDPAVSSSGFTYTLFPMQDAIVRYGVSHPAKKKILPATYAKEMRSN